MRDRFGQARRLRRHSQGHRQQLVRRIRECRRTLHPQRDAKLRGRTVRGTTRTILSMLTRESTVAEKPSAASTRLSFAQSVNAAQRQAMALHPALFAYRIAAARNAPIFP